MTFVVTENCIKCKYMDCVEVCPVDCFHVGPNFLVIDPDFIEDTNLNRLVGATMEDVRLGRFKVDIAERVIKAVNPAAEVVKHVANWTEVTAEPRDADVIFACVDLISCRSELEAFA